MTMPELSAPTWSFYCPRPMKGVTLNLFPRATSQGQAVLAPETAARVKYPYAFVYCALLRCKLAAGSLTYFQKSQTECPSLGVPSDHCCFPNLITFQEHFFITVEKTPSHNSYAVLFRGFTASPAAELKSFISSLSMTRYSFTR